MTIEHLQELKLLELVSLISKTVKRDFRLCKDCLVTSTYRMTNDFFVIDFDSILHVYDEVSELHKFEFYRKDTKVFVFNTIDNTI